MAKKFLAGVARALLFANNELIAACKTLTESTFNFAIENESRSCQWALGQILP